MLDEQYRRQGFERITERTESTMAEAVRLLAREALTGSAPPPSARACRRSVAAWLEERIGKDFARARRAIHDQDAYARAARKLLADLDIDSARPTTSDRRGAAGRRGRRRREPERGRRRHRRRAGHPWKARPADGAAEDAQDAAEAGDGEMMPGTSDDDPGRPGRPGQMPRGRTDDDRGLPRLQRRLGRGDRGRKAVRRRTS